MRTDSRMNSALEVFGDNVAVFKAVYVEAETNEVRAVGVVRVNGRNQIADTQGARGGRCVAHARSIAP
jgi:hypothetical protein